MAGSLRTEAIVLRSIRYGEADRVLHLYTPGYGRLSAIAKGVRRARSRFGARLEPFFHIRVILHQGRSDLHTVTSVDTIAAYRSLREHAATLDAGARACDAVARLFETPDPHPEVSRLLTNELDAARPRRRQCASGERARVSPEAAARRRHPAPAGVVRDCGESEHLQGFSAAAGGVVCNACEAAAFPLSQESHSFLVGALSRPLAQAPDASEFALAQAERAITETAEHHVHVRLRPLLGTARGSAAVAGSMQTQQSVGGRHHFAALSIWGMLMASAARRGWIAAFYMGLLAGLGIAAARGIAGAIANARAHRQRLCHNSSRRAPALSESRDDARPATQLGNRPSFRPGGGRVRRADSRPRSPRVVAACDAAPTPRSASAPSRTAV